MTVSEETKAIKNQIKQHTAQCNFDRETAKISALSSENFSKYEFLTGKDVLPEKRLARKSCNNEKILIFTFRQRIKNTN